MHQNQFNQTYSCDPILSAGLANGLNCGLVSHHVGMESLNSQTHLQTKPADFQQ